MQVLTISPADIQHGDKIATKFDSQDRPIKWSEPVKRFEVNPRGCFGNTHVANEGCYSNICSIVVMR